MTENKQAIPMSINPVFNYVSNAQIAMGEEEFIIALTSGNQIFQFALSPKHTKRVKMLLDKYVDEYESRFGKLETKLQEMKKETAEKDKIGF